MEEILRLGIVGCGYGAQVLVPAFRSDARVHVVGISAQHPVKAEETAHILTIPAAFGDWRSLLDLDRIDAIAIAAPPHAQTEIALSALSRGLAVFAEKPLAASLAAAQSVVVAAKASRCANVVDFNFREVAAFKAVRETLRSGGLGAIRHVAVNWHVESYANQMKLRSWKTDIGSGGGALANFVSHSFDYLEWFLGPIVSLSAGLAGMPEDIRENDTFAGLTMRFESGAAGGLIMSAAAYRGSGHRIEIYGEEGSLVLDNPGSDYMRGFRLLFAERPNGPVAAELASNEDDIWKDGRVLPASRLARRFVDWALGGEACEPSFAAGLRVQTLIEAARQSSASCRWVDTPMNGIG